jgi:DNA modification methylase
MVIQCDAPRRLVYNFCFIIDSTISRQVVGLPALPSTLIAAEQTGRRAFLMELDALYCDVIVERWEKFTGRKAERSDANKKTPALAGEEV